jgi:hypothetical protein
VVSASWHAWQAEGVRATLILADAAQVDPGGKVHLIGGGWSITASPLGAFSVVVLIAVDWSETNMPHVAVLRLEDADGRVVGIQGEHGVAPLSQEHRFEVGRPAGVPEGSSVDVPVVLTFGPGLNLATGRYLWRLEIDGRTLEPWSLPFVVRAPASPS